MAGVVVVAGVYEPGSVVTLFQVPDERVLRPEGGDIIGKRIVDDSGNVGWDDLEVGARYFIAGYVTGNYVLTRAIGTDAEAPDTQHLSQPPIQPTPQKIGTQEATAPNESPAIAEEHKDLPVGVPDAVSTGVLEPPQDVSTTEPLYLVDGEQVPATLQASDRQTPQEGAADGSTKASQLLFKPTDGQPLDPIPDGIVRSEGPTLAVAPVSEPVEPTPASSEPSSEPAAPAPDVAPPAQPDVPPQTQPVPSESAGVGEAAGAPSEQAQLEQQGIIAPETPPAAPPTEAPADVPAAPDAAQPAAPATDGGAGPAAEAAPAPADQVPAPEAAPAAADAQPAAAPAAPDAAPQPPSS